MNDISDLQQCPLVGQSAVFE